MFAGYDSDSSKSPSRSRSPKRKEKEEPPTKKRKLAHVEGHFPTWVYLDCATVNLNSDDPGGNSQSWLPTLQYQAADSLLAGIGSQNKRDVQLLPNPHISLGPLIMLRHHFIDSFTKDIKTALSDSKLDFTVYFDPGNVDGGEMKFDLFSNTEHNRFFAAIPVAKGGIRTKILELQKRIRPVLVKYDTSGQSHGENDFTGDTDAKEASSSDDKKTMAGRPHLSLVSTLIKPEVAKETNKVNEGGEDYGPNCWPHSLPVPKTNFHGELPKVLCLKITGITVQVGNRYHKVEVS